MNVAEILSVVICHNTKDKNMATKLYKTYIKLMIYNGVTLTCPLETLDIYTCISCLHQVAYWESNPVKYVKQVSC